MNKTLRIIIGLVALGAVLLYNFVHTGNILASFIDPSEVGYIAAGGIEAIVIFLSMQISERRRDKRSTRLFVGALVAVVVVSALANVAEGYAVKFGKPLEVAVFGATDFAQLVVWLSSTGLLSLVVFAMAEIIGDDMTANTQDVTPPATEQHDEPQAQPSETLLTLVPNQAHALTVPSRALSDIDILTFWRAHGQADAWQQVSTQAHECLNGTSGYLERWYGDKRSISGLCNALGIVDAAQVKRVGSLVRGIIKPVIE